MVLYTCGAKKHAGGLPGPAAHPCGRAAKALDDAGYSYELKVVGGYRLVPWTWGSRSRDRAEVKRLSGQQQVPILVLDDGEVISGPDDLHVPHLLLAERAFVLRPLVDVAPDLEHPTLYATVRELLAALADEHTVRAGDYPARWFED